MKYTCILVALVFVGTFASSLARGETEGESPKRPNILFIMTDQQSATMMSCTGNQYVKTPALDRLARSGIRFERAYAPNPVCEPCRYSIQTGLMPSTIGMRQNTPGIKADEMTLPDTLGPVMRRGGYECAYGGKVHLPGNLAKYMFAHGYRNLTGDARGGLARASADFIRQKHEKPFFLFVSLINPHDICFMALNEYARQQGKRTYRSLDSRICEQTLDKVRNREDLARFVRQECPPLPSNFKPTIDEPEAISKHYTLVRPFRQYARKQWTEEKWRLHRWLYARLTEMVDTEIAEILDALRESGLEEETLVIFTSDHGDMDGAHGLEHKSIPYEEAARIPFIMSWKGKVPAGRVDRTHLVSNGLDLLPTICDYAGVKPPGGLPGRSLRPLAGQSQPKQWREHLVVESQNGLALVTGRYKYFLFESGKNPEMLIDLKNDPGEKKNIAGDPGSRRVLDEHRRLLCDWADQQKDKSVQGYLVRPE